MAIYIVTDSTSNIDENHRKSLAIQVIPLKVHFPDETFDEAKVSYDYFFNRIIKEHIIPSSSRPAEDCFYDTFQEIVAQGDEVLGIFLSSKMSSTYQTALSAKGMIMEKYPQARIEIMDSKTNSMALGLQVIEAAKASQDANTMEEVMAAVLSIRERIHFYFVPASLQYLIKGGRVGSAAAIVGSMLNVCPVLYVNNGMTDVFDRVRGNSNAIKRMLSILNRDARAYGLSNLLVHHIHAAEQGQELADKLSQQYNIQVPSIPLGPVIGLHAGPGTLAIVYTTEK